MDTVEINTTLVDSYLGLLENLSSSNKLELISKLSNSVKTDLLEKKSLIKESFGAFESSKTAEEIIAEIRNSRVFNKETESF
jgi:hypothetical protein